VKVADNDNTPNQIKQILSIFLVVYLVLVAIF
jgi:hypothetical protein